MGLITAGKFDFSGKEWIATKDPKHKKKSYATYPIFDYKHLQTLQAPSTFDWEVPRRMLHLRQKEQPATFTVIFE